MIVSDSHALWDAEYRSGRLPSSTKETPSTTVLWGLSNLPFLGVELGPDDEVLDVGCGRGRNALEIAARTGARVIGIDYSKRAVEAARMRAGSAPESVRARVSFEHRDLRDGLPGTNGSISLVTDIFVYFHLIEETTRAAYREELLRALRPGGALLLSLAPPDDGYYSRSAPNDVATRGAGGVPAAFHARVGVGHILHTSESLRAELAPRFRPSMWWRKVGNSVIDGHTCPRVTLAMLSIAETGTQVASINPSHARA